MSWKNNLLKLLGLGLGFFTILQPIPAKSAEKLRLIYGPLNLSVSIDSLETFAETGEITEEFKFFTQFLDEKTLSQLRQQLQRRFNFNQVTVYKVTRTSLVEDLLKEIGQVVQTHSQGNGMYALRGALIQAAANPDGWTVIDVMRQFPTENVQINANLLLDLKKELSKFISYRQAAVRAIISQSQQEAASNNIDLSQLRDLREKGPLSFRKETITVDKDKVRQTPQGLATKYSFKADIYIPQGDTQQQYPVIIVSHGFGSLTDNFVKLAEHLASYGFIVAVPDHIGSDLAYRQELLDGNLSSFLSPIEFIDRPLDITYLIDKLEELAANDAKWAEKLNLQQIGLIGDSLGGTTVLSLAGAQINIPRLKQECAADKVILNASVLLQCQASYLPPLKYNLLDPRIKAVIASHPVTSEIFGADGLAKIDIPILIAAGSDDIITPVVEEQIHPFIWLKAPEKYLVLYQPGYHFTSSQPPEEYKADYLPEALIGKNRLQGSRYFNGLSVAFMEVYLRSNSEYLPYLTAAYGEKVSDENLQISMIKSLTPEQLITAYGSQPPEPIFPDTSVATVTEKPENILTEIERTGVLKIAFRTDSPPFGYLDNEGQWRGYCSQLGDSLAEYLQAKLNLSVTPKVVKIPSNLSNRFELVKSDTVHLECGPNTIRTDIAGVDFSNIFFVTGSYFLIAESKINEVNPNQSLRGVKIGVLRNTTTEKFVQQRYPQAEKIYFEGETANEEAIKAVLNNQIDAFVNDGILLLAESALQKLSDKQYELVPKVPLTCDYYGLILPNNDDEWVNTINAFLDSKQAKLIGDTNLAEAFRKYEFFNLDYCLNIQPQK